MTKRCRNPSQEFDEATGRCETVSRFLRECPEKDQERNPRTGYCRRKRSAAAAAPPTTQRKKRKTSSSTTAKRRRAPTVAQLASTVDGLVAEMEVLRARVDAAAAATAPLLGDDVLSLSPIDDMGSSSSSTNSPMADWSPSVEFGDVYPESPPFAMENEFTGGVEAAENDSVSPFRQQDDLLVVGTGDGGNDNTVTFDEAEKLRASIDAVNDVGLEDYLTKPIKKHPRSRRNKLMLDDGYGGQIAMVAPSSRRSSTANKKRLGRGGSGATKRRPRRRASSPPHHHDSIRSPRTYLEN